MENGKIMYLASMLGILLVIGLIKLGYIKELSEKPKDVKE